MNGSKELDCAYCDKENLSKDVIGLNKKIVHRQIQRLLCLSCMAVYFETTEDELCEKIEEFKRQGCALFG